MNRGRSGAKHKVCTGTRLALSDLHACMGDGELSGTGINPQVCAELGGLSVTIRAYAHTAGTPLDGPRLYFCSNATISYAALL